MDDNEERASLCERILSDLNNIFKRDLKNILEFDIIDIDEPTCNKSPVVYIEHNLGLEKWCVPHLYCYAYKHFLRHKVDNCNRTASDLLHQWTRILLLINPDFTTGWNVRRDLVSKGKLYAEDELCLTELLLLRRPKCASVFSYREFLLNHALDKSRELDEHLVTNELAVCLKAAERYRRNYYAWSHRTWLFTIYLNKSIESCDDGGHVTVDYLINKMFDDLVATEQWLECYISEYSAFVHRQCLHGHLHKLTTSNAANSNSSNANNENTLQAEKAKQKFVAEFEWIESLLPLYIEHESVFLHRRHMLHAAKLWYPEILDNLKQQEINFNSKYLLSSTDSWTSLLIRQYHQYLERNLDWKFSV